MPALLLSEIIGQPEAVEFLTRVAASGRYANAYLLHGPAGVGKGSAALGFARAMMCERGAGHSPRPQGPLFDALAPAKPAATARKASEPSILFCPHKLW